MNRANHTVRCSIVAVTLFASYVPSSVRAAEGQVRIGGVQRVTGVEVLGGLTHVYSGTVTASREHYNPGLTYTAGATYWFTDVIGLSGRYVGDNRRADRDNADGGYRHATRWDPGYLTVTFRRRWLLGKHRKGELDWGAGVDLYNDSREQGKAVLTGFVLTEVLGGYMYSDRWGVKGGGVALNRG